MGRPRTTGKHPLSDLSRVYWKHGAYWYVQPITNKWIRLGSDQLEARLAHAKICSIETRYDKINDLFDKYMIEVAPKKALSTYKQNLRQIKMLREVFGEMHPEDAEAVHGYEYLHRRGKESPVAANREFALLSHVFTCARQWGAVKDNPFLKVERHVEHPRKRDVQEWELLAVRNLSNDPMMQYAMDLARLIGQRKADVLKIKIWDLGLYGITVWQNKSGGKVRLIITWTEKLLGYVRSILSIRKDPLRTALICTQRAQEYTPDGWSSNWQRLMDKAMAEGVIQERFTFQDIRALAAGEATNSESHATELLGHTNPKTTKRHYLRKPKHVKPTR